MQIVGVNSKLCGPDKYALNIKPSLTPEMFAEIKRISVTPLLSGLYFQNVEGCLVFQCPGGLDEHVSTKIEEMLKLAAKNIEELQSKRESQAEIQARLEQAMKESVTKSAASLFKVPIQ